MSLAIFLSFSKQRCFPNGTNNFLGGSDFKLFNASLMCSFYPSMISSSSQVMQQKSPLHGESNKIENAKSSTTSSPKQKQRNTAVTQAPKPPHTLQVEKNQQKRTTGPNHSDQTMDNQQINPTIISRTGKGTTTTLLQAEGIEPAHEGEPKKKETTLRKGVERETLQIEQHKLLRLKKDMRG